MKMILFAGALLAGFTPHALAQYPDWQHSGSLYILTTPEGADLPASATEKGLSPVGPAAQGLFDFSHAKANGEDIRFSADGQPLAYQIEDSYAIHQLLAPGKNVVAVEVYNNNGPAGILAWIDLLSDKNHHAISPPRQKDRILPRVTTTPPPRKWTAAFRS